MLKKLFVAVLAIFGLVATACASDVYTHDDSVLPASAKSTIANFCNSKVSVVKIDKELGRVSEYEVVLQDGTEITFDSKGNWEDVEVNNDKAVPAGFIPKGVAAFVKNAQGGQRIVGIDKSRNGYEVTLANGVEMKFNKQGEFVSYDD